MGRSGGRPTEEEAGIISDPIKVLLADDHTLFREGLAQLLTSYGGLEVVGEGPNDEVALTLAQEKNPDVVIMQVQIPFEKARQALLKMRRIRPPPKVIIVTMFERPSYLQEMLDLGIRAYLLKSVSVEELVGTIRAATLDPAGENAVISLPRQMIEKGEDGSSGVLSTREMEILLLAARGLSNYQIARSVGLAEATVKRHLSNAYEKMAVHTRGEAVRSALSLGWVTIGEITQEEEEGDQGA
jgi:DNA-binding NarL/FixJ family response regulator